ncbi:hypothetical protein H6F43_02695 [Leptolyngbya sp. FACHB-36]|uniref:hypothetical protein n=1 Tax=Leptolyngbya sp. FACHB-36 TaxID=2692808 RepID=UPI001680BDB2|nr:hypothetical protein [Leptolyngbya sp. FACHB-36]MBD2019093.1 hypothetical protein [Leptolyngbya sp. FACHB-36]
MNELRANLEPGNPDGHTVLRYLVEEKRLPLETAIERVYAAVMKYQHEFRAAQSKLILGSVVTGVMGLPISLPIGLPAALVVGSMATAIYAWMELGAQRDRLKPEYVTLKRSHLLENVIRFLAVNLSHQHDQQQQQMGQGFPLPSSVHELTPKTILQAYEDTVMQVAQGDHLDNNASDPVLALFVVNLRSHTNFLPEWVMQALRELEVAEQQRRQQVERANQFMFGDLSRQAWELAPATYAPAVQPLPAMPMNQPQIQRAIGQTTRLNAVNTTAQPLSPDTPWEDEQRPKKREEGEKRSLPVPDASLPPTEIERPLYDVRTLANTGYVESILWIGFSQSGKTTTADQLGRALRQQYGTRLRAYYITPVLRSQGDNDERSLFAWCDKLLRFPLLNETDDFILTAAYEQFEALLEEFLTLPSDRMHPKLFVADELTIHALYAVGTRVGGVKIGKPNAAAQSFFGKLVNAINANASGGKASGIGIWGLSPSAAVGGIGLNQNAMSSCVPVFIGSVANWNGGVHAAAARNNLAPQHPPTVELLHSCQRHGIERLISVGCGEWQPLMAYSVPRPIALSAAQRQAINPVNQPESQQMSSLYDELANDFDAVGTMPMMGDFIRWLKTKQGTVITRRNAILLWGNKKNRNVTSNEAISPFLREAIDLGLLKETEDGYRVICT